MIKAKLSKYGYSLVAVLGLIVLASVFLLVGRGNKNTSMPAPTLTVGDNLTVRQKDGMEMVYVPAGEFEMGSSEEEIDYAMELCSKAIMFSECARSWFGYEKPVHTVALDGFWIDRTEASNTQYEKCVEAEVCRASNYAHDSDFNGEDHPVVGVSWNDARVYCEWIDGRLPTEAEWEYAARGAEGRVFPWGDKFDSKKLNYCDMSCPRDWRGGRTDGHGRTAPVGRYPDHTSWCGAQDMVGNVSEWTADWYRDYPAGRQVNPTVPTGQYRVVRGGSWEDISLSMRCSSRELEQPAYRGINIGFRCAIDH